MTLKRAGARRLTKDMVLKLSLTVASLQQNRLDGVASRRPARILASGAALMLLACNSAAELPVDGKPKFDHRELGPIELKAELLSEEPAIGLPVQLQLSEGALWVADMSADPGLHLLDAATGELVYSAGRVGQGPGEFSASPFGLEVRPTDGSGAIWAWDMKTQRLNRFEPRPLREFELVTITLQGTPIVSRVAWVGPSRIVGVAASAEARFALFSASGERERVVAGVLLGSDDIPLDLRVRATEYINVRTWPGRGFVIAHGAAGRIEYYNADAEFVRMATVPFPSEPVFERDDTGKVTFNRDRRWYVNCAATRDLLFALFSGRSRTEYDWEGNQDDWETSQSAQYVHVFDWAGQLRAVYHLDRDVVAIVLDPSGRFLYAGSLSDSRIYRYQLPATPEA
jgi:hypothetical protein